MRNRTSTIRPRNTRARRGRAVLMVAATTGLFGAGLLASVAPASAQVLDTDYPRANAGSHAFGKNWVLGAPVNGGDLRASSYRHCFDLARTRVVGFE